MKTTIIKWTAALGMVAVFYSCTEEKSATISAIENTQKELRIADSTLHEQSKIINAFLEKDTSLINKEDSIQLAYSQKSESLKITINQLIKDSDDLLSQVKNDEMNTDNAEKKLQQIKTDFSATQGKRDSLLNRVSEMEKMFAEKMKALAD